MQDNRWIKWLIIATVTIVMTACGGGGSPEVSLAPEVAKIVNWVKNGGTAPTAEDYEAAGVELNGHSADEINRYIQQYYAEHASSGAFDSEAELNQIAEDLGVTILDTDGDGTYDIFDPTPNGDAHTPVVSINQVGGTVFTTETVSLSATAIDPDGDSLTYVWSLDTKPEGSQAELQTPMSLTSSFIPDVSGEYTVHFYAYDGSNLSPKKRVTFLAVVRGECVDLDELTDWPNVLTLDKPCYTARQITIAEDETLIIKPGTTVIFKDNLYNSLTVNGTLKAIGTAEEVITFTSNTKEDGAWTGLLIGGNKDNEIDHVVIEYANRGIEVSQKLSLKNSLITHSKKYGLWGHPTMDLDIENITFKKNDTPIYIYAHKLHMLNNNNTYEDNTHNYVKVDADPNGNNVIDFDQTWHKISVPYLFVDYGPVVEYNATLTIEPGVEVQFTQHNDFKVDGTIIAKGTEADPIVFTVPQELIDNNDTWVGLHLRHNEYFDNTQNHEFQHLTLEYARKGLRLKGNENTNISILDTTFQHNSSDGFTLEGKDINLIFKRVISTKNNRPGEIYPYMLSILDDTSNFTGNKLDLLSVHKFSIDEDQVWNKQSVPIFTAGIFVDDDATLTINKGATIAITPSTGISVWNRGTLIANGTDSEKIRFIGATQSLTGYEESRWYGFGIYGNMEMSHVKIEKAGGYYTTHNAGTEGAIVILYGASATMSNSSFIDSGKHAIYIECQGSLTESGNTFLNSGDVDIKYQTNCE